ncbi:hypothetical protein HDC92_004121 [Pedobacter sp. AK017]|uniref:hypothetical protein n=1 Tax=Pedobacter sp. AK017 TaxID=2723073 RepID=UPI001607F349|nr:hypothetical protein [Pedobacter sp. AK017]MBB5440420.1 hypothetical protein [Pedobacter sp. AK017]
MSLETTKITDERVEQRNWNSIEKYFFRTFFIFFFVLIVPLNLAYYQQWFHTDWANLHIRDMGKLSGSSFNPIKVAGQRPGANDTGGIPVSKQSLLTIYPESGEFGLASYINWGLAFVIGLAGAAIWTVADRKTKNYNTLYYFLAAGVSYAMLIQLQGLTFSKIFPTQMPQLALTQLNTPFGDFVAQKLYWIQFSFVHDYEIFAGFAELLIMLFLFFRPTRALGAALALAMIGNIAFANHAYDGGIHLAATFYALGGAFVLWRYVPPLWKLIVKEENAELKMVYYPFSRPWEKNGRIAFKLFVFGFFFVTSAWLHWQNYRYDSYKVPSRPGLANARGLYDVAEFRINNKIIPYSPLDSVRWQDVTFEKWSTLSFSVFNTFMIHGEAGRGKQFKDVDRTYESAGTGGGRRHFYYETDTVNHILHLQNKNKVYAHQQFELHYSRPTASQVILWGKNEHHDSIYVVLNRKDKTYPLYQYQ